MCLSNGGGNMCVPVCLPEWGLVMPLINCIQNNCQNNCP
jgi:hypothetical protein